MNPQVDQYLIDGCGRCELGGTPECKVHSWTDILVTVRQILNNTELEEERKWGVPCYTLNGKNIVILSALKDSVTLGFFKGALLKDEPNLLKKPGKNSQAARQFVFTDIQQVVDNELIIKQYVEEAINIEKAGLSIDFKAKNQLEYPSELITKFEEYPDFKKAFEALTPGRQRGYILYFSAPKKSETRSTRIIKFLPKIMAGLGYHDR